MIGHESALSIFSYWGKARPPGEADANGPPCHLLIYHCLDVAAVAAAWLSRDKALMDAFVRCSGMKRKTVRAWVLFYLALHDLGKWEVRFQLKVPEVALLLNPLFVEADSRESPGFDHGGAGLALFVKEREGLGFKDIHEDWMLAVAGHHGRMPVESRLKRPPASPAVILYDRQARSAFVTGIRELFLDPAGVAPESLEGPPPAFLAGFCSVCDWLGSSTDHFAYEAEPMDLEEYWTSARETAERAVTESGLFRVPLSAGGMGELFPEFDARGVQQTVGQWPVKRGLTLIEASTGSGKTEAAVAYASRLLAAGLADGIICALPTQATANAMLSRFEAIAGRLFPHGGNVVLAHGKARFNREFKRLKENAEKAFADGGGEGPAQCARWLSSSRKRLFLGQIGVCTIDQVFLSVLPVRHNFVRAFGLHKSVLIVDEIHAYDSYMNGLLDCVLKRQKEGGGSVILLSATLPARRRLEILRLWGDGGTITQDAPYPLVSHEDDAGSDFYVSHEVEENKSVHLEKVPAEEVLPSDELISAIVAAAQNGARVAVVCNLVKDAQLVAGRLREVSAPNGISVALFHSRFLFRDRQRIEEETLATYGKEASREKGRILIATQVIEQSLDLDFDWMITQLCPADLLFQRMGRLHRHNRPRPEGFETPRCTVVLPSGDDFGSHLYVYEDKRVLWRTRELLWHSETVEFPHAYRAWIEDVYSDSAWKDEPEAITGAHEKYIDEGQSKRFAALQLVNGGVNLFSDTDAHVTALTRDGEMSLSVIPVVNSGGAQCLLDGTRIKGLSEWQRDEVLSMNAVPVPGGWRHHLPDQDADGCVYLPMARISDRSWRSETDRVTFTYDLFFGMERIDESFE